MERIIKLLDFLKATPQDNFLRHALALEYTKIGETQKARTLFIEVLTDSPNYIGSYYHLAKLLESTNEIELATKYYEKGLEEAKKAKDNHSYNELQAAYEDLIY